MKSFTRFRYISYLDLVTCSFGSALLLFLVAVSASPVAAPTERPDELVVVRCKTREGPRAEVGIQFKSPGDLAFQQPGREHPDVRAFSARSGPDSGGEAFLVLLRPQAGLWQFRPYQKDFPDGANEGAIRAEVEVIGQRVEILEPELRGGNQLLQGPGDVAAQITRVRIRR